MLDFFIKMASWCRQLQLIVSEKETIAEEIVIAYNILHVIGMHIAGGTERIRMRKHLAMALAHRLTTVVARKCP